MKVVFCFPFIEFLLLVTHVYSSTLKNGDESEISTTVFSDTGSTDNAILGTTKAPPIVKPANPCSSPNPPVISSSTNTSTSMDHPEISWKLTVNPITCQEQSFLHITCTNIQNKADVETIKNNVTRKKNVSFELLTLKAQATYRCYGILKTGSKESKRSKSIGISTIKTGNKEKSVSKRTTVGTEYSTAFDAVERSSAATLLRQRSRVAYLDYFATSARTSEATLLESTEISITSSNPLLDLTSETSFETSTSGTTTPKLCTLTTPVVKTHTNSSIKTTHPTITWKLTIDRELCGETITFSVKCTNVKNKTDVATINENIADNVKETEVSSKLDSLKGPAMYSCYGVLKTNTAIESQSSGPIIVSTIITGKITIVKLVPKARSIFIEWDALPLATELNYSVNITEMKAGHFSPDCGKSNKTITSRSTKQNVYNFTGASPDYNYSILISTIIRNNLISSDVNVTTTSAAAPGKPRNVVVKNSTKDNGLPNILILSWDMPCNPNGRIQRFDIELTGVYMPDHSHKNSKKFNYTLTTSNQEHFVRTLEGLNGSTDYTLKIKAVGANGDAGVGVETSFVTTEAIPSAPDVYIASQSSSYLDIRWKLPDDVLFGKITNYNLVIVPLKPAYGKYPSSCPAQNPKYQKLDGATTSLNYSDARGYWIYGIFVSASTSQGTGRNGTLKATTNTSAPEMPRNLDVSIPEIDDGSTNVTKLISWDVPCFPNGRIYEYRFSVSGYYTVDGSHAYASSFKFPVTKTDREHYNVTIEQLNASTNYTLNITAIGENGEGSVLDGTFTTKDAIPDAPVMDQNQFNISNSWVTIVWNSTNRKAGKIIYYKIEVTPLRPLYFIPDDCPQNRGIPQNFTVSESNSWGFGVLPYYSYKVGVAAATQRGLGKFSYASFNTKIGVPEKVRFLNFTPPVVTQEEYDAFVIIKFKRPCFTNGNLTNIKLKYTGTRPAFGDIFLDQSIKFSNNPILEYKIALKPEYSYQIGVTASNDEFNNTYQFPITAPSGVPLMDTRHPVEISGIRLTGADVTLRKEQFDNSNGDIKYISLILSEIAQQSDQFGAWNGNTWPEVYNETEYQLTKDFWNPFKVDNVVTFSIGSASPRCPKPLKYCNEPLKEDKEYYLIIRMFTNSFYKNSPAIFFKTGKSWTGFILGLIFGLLIAGILAIIAYILWKKGLFQIIMNRFPRKTHTNPESTTKIPCKKFLQYCKNMECNPQKYQEQYTLLTEEAKQITAAKTISIATLPENRRKNRYTNIAPYDETRVELRIDEDDEIGSDYINASFIKGYSGYIEYIATQGPMVTTTRDFWKMVLQENVTLIVMVSQFVENDKQKCHRYFPKNHESMTISDDMEVRCSTELHFGTYCVRNLQIRKDDLQATVTHMQFLEWPDFGVPNGTDHVLQFCYQLRERIRIDGGLIIVHCSAGVGRTGTLIATDILLQSANAGKHIDVYNTVLELRKQRVMMVQTDKQYIFIHSMLKDHLDRPPSPDLMENSEPVYENMEIIQDRNSVMNAIKNEDESKF